MEDLKLRRANARRQFTKAWKTFDNSLAEENPDKEELEVIYKHLVRQNEELNKLNEAGFQFLLTMEEEEALTELDRVEEYRNAFDSIEVKYNRTLKKDGAAREAENTVKEQSLNVSNGSVKSTRLPRLGLVQYELTYRNFIAWNGQMSRIDEDANFTDREKFHYLLQSLVPGCKAHAIVSNYPPLEENYVKAYDQLKVRFGNKQMLIEVYIRDLISLLISQLTSTQVLSVSDLYDKLQSYLNNLEALNVTHAEYSAMLYPMIESCLPADVIKSWERRRRELLPNTASSLSLSDEDHYSDNESNRLNDLMNFLQLEVLGEERVNLARKDFLQPTTTFTAQTLVNQQSKTQASTCIFCEKSHSAPPQECITAQAMPLPQRKEAVLKKRACFICLKVNHGSRNCRSANFIRCIICEARHFPILCEEIGKKKNSPKQPDFKDAKSKDVKGGPSSDEKETKAETDINLTAVSNGAFLKTLCVKVKYQNREKTVRVLLDDGSQGSYISKSLASELNLPKIGNVKVSHGLFGGTNSPEVVHAKFKVRIVGLDGNDEYTFTALDSEQICGRISRVNDHEIISELKQNDIRLSDVEQSNECNDPRIHILLGAGEICDLMTGSMMKLKCGLLAIQTQLGWVLMGRNNNQTGRMLSLLNTEIPKLWQLDTIGIVDDISAKSQKCVDDELYEKFKSNVTVNEVGRYEMPLTWLENHPPLDNNYDVARVRLQRVTMKLINDHMIADYDNVFQEWESQGIVERASSIILDGNGYYLPHRPVIKESSESTRIRPVFDGGSHSKNSVSLNDCLSKGCNLLGEIFPLLLRFRLNAIGVTADIRQAFLQLSIVPDQRSYLQFLWHSNVQALLNNGKSEIITFQSNRAVFGVSCSPFLLNGTLKYHLEENRWGPEFEDTLVAMRKSFYVDDLTYSVDSERQLMIFKSQSIQIMSDAKFELTKWHYSGEKIDDRSVLGTNWDVFNDKVGLKVNVEQLLAANSHVTKRAVLSMVSKVYDVMGMCCAAMLTPKMLLREAWKRGLDWDTELPQDLVKKFHKWLKSFHLICDIKIPRWLISKNGQWESCSLHTFSDASINAYSAVIFLRYETADGVKLSFVAAKNRLAPAEQASICRLELMGAVIAIRLWETVQREMPECVESYYWTDSTVTLCWITNQNEVWSKFVQNRVEEIRKKCDVTRFRFVPGELNCADLPSRGCDFEKFIESKWIEGPQWLKENESLWPSRKVDSSNEALKERKKSSIHHNLVLVDLKNENIVDWTKQFCYFGKYWKNIRACAWMFRFLNNIDKKRPKVSEEELSNEEIEKAEIFLLKEVQTLWDEADKRKFLDSDQIHVTYDNNGLMRLKTKLLLGNYTNYFQEPIVLPIHFLTWHLIMDTHLQFNHCGVQTTCSKIREKFWIYRGRKEIRKVLNHCFVCKRFASKPVDVDSAPLPVERIELGEVFAVTGCDLAGPLLLKDESKVWIVLFTCAVYRAVHLEIVTSLSAESFMLSVRRAIARRGRFKVLMSDCGSNFKKLDSLMRELDWNEIIRQTGVLRIKWKFNCPGAAWWGGYWEKIVGVLKQALRKCLGRAMLTYEELSTVLCDIESVVNSRPLTYVSESPSELMPITPMMFLQDLKSNEVYDMDVIEGAHLLKRYNYLQEVRSHLRDRFRNEYLGQLIQTKVVDNPKCIRKGDVVLVVSEGTKRISWPMGIVLEVYEGKDGLSRSAKIKLPHGELTRPMQKLVPLELSSAEADLLQSKQKKLVSSVPTKDVPTKLPSVGIEKDVSPEVPRATKSGRQVTKPVKLDL